MRHRNRKVTSIGITLILTAVLALSGCKSESDNSEVALQDIEFQPEGVLDFIRPDSSIISRIFVELAETLEAQATGLMYRRSLPEKAGMLFVFDAPAVRSFWMKNTALSLDIIFVDPDGHIINIAKRTTPYSEDFVASDDLALFVVEVRAGYTEKYGITENDQIRWERRTFQAPE